MSRLAVFIDGGYLDSLAQDEFNIHVDYSKLNAEIIKVISTQSPGIELLRTYYYHCLPYQSNPPSTSEATRFSKMQSFLDSLSRLPRFTVRQGRLVFRGNKADGTPIFQQKRTDLLLGLDFALLSGKNQITHVAVLAGDSDLLPAFKVAKDEGILVWLFHGPRRCKKDNSSTFADELWREADERHEIDTAFMKRIQFPSKK
jgi:uncharacterized LabA/DUF88 family protein